MRRLPEYLANQALKFAIPQGLLGFGQLSTLCNCGGKALSQVHNKKPIFCRFPPKASRPAGISHFLATKGFKRAPPMKIKTKKIQQDSK